MTRSRRTFMHALGLLLCLPFCGTTPCHAAHPRHDPDSIHFADLFYLHVREYGGKPYLNTGPDSMRGDARLEARFTALWPYHMYLYDNYADAFGHETALAELLPDTQAARVHYDELLMADTAFQHLMAPSIRSGRVAPLHIDSALRIAAHFYYMHREDNKVVTHVCTGINKVMSLGTSHPDAHHAAFCYMAIWNMKDHFAPFSKVAKPFRKELKANPSDERLKELEQVVYERMAQVPKLREALIAEYERKAAYLPFELVR